MLFFIFYRCINAVNQEGNFFINKFTQFLNISQEKHYLFLYFKVFLLYNNVEICQLGRKLPVYFK